MNWWRILLYRWRHGQWCTHEDETGRLIDLGRQKMFTCHDCGRVTFA
jgi:hypothetical protein